KQGIIVHRFAFEPNVRRTVQPVLADFHLVHDLRGRVGVGHHDALGRRTGLRRGRMRAFATHHAHARKLGGGGMNPRQVDAIPSGVSYCRDLQQAHDQSPPSAGGRTRMPPAYSGGSVGMVGISWSPNLILPDCATGSASSPSRLNSLIFTNATP